MQGTVILRDCVSKGKYFQGGLFPSGLICKGINLQGSPVSKALFPRPYFQGPISKAQLPRPNFQGPISKAQFPRPNMQGSICKFQSVNLYTKALQPSYRDKSLLALSKLSREGRIKTHCVLLSGGCSGCPSNPTL